MLSNLLFWFFLIISPSLTQAKSFTILIDPAGDGKNTGRSLYQGFERGLTLQFATELRNQLLAKYPNIVVIITRSAGEVLANLHNANFANHLNVDLFLHLSFYKESNIKPQVFIYHYQNQTFFFKPNQNVLDFYPYHQAYLFNFDQTKKWAKIIENTLQNPIYHHYFTCMPTIAMPFKPLVGMTVPAIGIEIGIKKNGYEQYFTPLINSLGQIFYAA